MATDVSSSPPDEALFKCTCEGENSNCIHCDGTGWTRRQVAVRSSGVRARLSDPNTETFQTQKEKLFARQVHNELPKLRSLFLEQEGLSPRPYLAFLTRLADALDENMRFFLTELAGGNLTALAMSLERVRTGPIEAYRIVANAAQDCLLDYERALEKKKSQPLPKQVAGASSRKPEEGARCSQCGVVIFDLRIHNRLAHPNLNLEPADVRAQKQVAPSVSSSPPHRSLQAVSPPEAVAPPPARIIRPTIKKLECPHCGTMIPSNHLDSHIQMRHRPPLSDTGNKGSKHVNPTVPNQPNANLVIPKKSKALPIKSGKRRTPPSSGLEAEFSRDGADVVRVEREMDARRTWGGRFRDMNGTFGSYPIHDNMDDESDAG